MAVKTDLTLDVYSPGRSRIKMIGRIVFFSTKVIIVRVKHDIFELLKIPFQIYNRRKHFYSRIFTMIS